MDGAHVRSDSCLGSVQAGSWACEKGPIFCMASVCSLPGPHDCCDLKLQEHVVQSGIGRSQGGSWGRE